MLSIRQADRSKVLGEPNKKTGVRRRVGTVGYVLFHPTELRVVGFAVERSDIAMMVARKDRYIALDRVALVDGERWFRTSDVGDVTDGVLHVHGRADDVVVSGGVNVVPSAVEAVLAGLGLEACVVGLPDDEWGQVVTAVVASPDAVDLEAVRKLRRSAETPATSGKDFVGADFERRSDTTRTVCCTRGTSRT